MIFTERTITVVNDSATINKPLILYRGDKNIELKITIAESQFKFRNTDASNVIETTDASYAQLVINTPYGLPIFSDVAATKNGAVIFVITEAMVDEIREVGAYEIQIRLLDDNKQSRASIPPVSNAIEIREPIAIEDGSAVDSNAVNVAKVNRALTTTSAPLEAFDSQGNYIKKTWGDGDPITDAALNKMEAGIDGVNKKIANVNNINDTTASATTTYSSNKIETIKRNISSQIKDKASNSDLEVERQRINNLIALPEGATINDARLEDICVSNDGINFSSPGNAVRAKGNMNKIAAEMGYTTYSHIDNSAWEIGTISSTDGAPTISDDVPTQRLRNNEFIPENIKRIVANDGFEFTLFTYKKSDNSFFKLQDFYPTTFIQHFDLHHDIKYKIVVKKIDNSDISIDDAANILFLTEDDLNNNIKNGLENAMTSSSQVKVLDWSYGAINNIGKLMIYNEKPYARLVVQNFLPTDVVRVVAPKDYELALVKYDLGGNYIEFVADPNIKASIRTLEEGYLYRVVLNRKDLADMDIDESNKVMFLNKNIETNFRYPSTVIVAASNSSYENKLIANYICDGVNDEVEIQKAIDTFGSASGQVILCNGNYYIDSLYDAGGNAGKFGLYISNPNNNHNVIIKGISHPNRKFSTEVGVAPTIFLNKTVYDNLADDEKVTLLGVLPNDTTNLTKVYPNINLTIENLAINIPGNQKAITMVSGEFASNMQIDYLLCSITGSPNYGVENNVISTTPNENCIGIRLLPGQNFGTGFSVRNCFVWGMNVAYDIGGEHLIMENCGCRLCNMSFRFNAYENEAKMSHPNTLINCCEESCKSSMYFCTSTVKQSVNIIDYNMEIRPNESIWGRENLAIEETPGSFRGNITFLANYENYINTDDIEFWQPGSGLHFKTRNLAAKLYGTTQERPSKPDIGQDYFDTTINKAIKFINNKWVDCMGNEV